MQLTQWALQKASSRLWGMGAWQIHPGGTPRRRNLAKAIYKDWCSSQGLQREWLYLGLQGKR